MHQPSVSWHMIPMKFSSWSIICFGQKEPISVQFFRLLSALMKVHPSSHAIFETTRLGFIQILHHCSASWKRTPLYFLAQSLYTSTKKPIEKKFSDFCVVWWKFTKFLMSYMKSQVSFSLNFASLSRVIKDNCSVLF